MVMAWLDQRVTHCPYVGCNCRHLLWCELRASLWRHLAVMLLGMRHAFADYFHDALPATIGPQPLVRGQVWRQRSALCVGAVAGVAGSSAFFTAKEVKALCDHLGCRSWWHGKSSGEVGGRLRRSLGF